MHTLHTHAPTHATHVDPPCTHACVCAPPHPLCTHSYIYVCLLLYPYCTEPSASTRLKMTAVSNTLHPLFSPVSPLPSSLNRALLSQVYTVWFLHLPTLMERHWNKRAVLDAAYQVRRTPVADSSHDVTAVGRSSVCIFSVCVVQQALELWLNFLASLASENYCLWICRNNFFSEISQFLRIFHWSFLKLCEKARA